MLASREADDYVLSSERRVIRLRQHWAVVVKALVEAVVLFVLLAVAAGFVSPEPLAQNIFFYGALLVLLRFTYEVVEWWVKKIVVTDKRVLIAEGIFTHRVGMMPLTKVTDLTFERSVPARVFGYGSLLIESAGQIQAFSRIDFVPQPEEFYQALMELVFGDKRPPGGGATATRSAMLGRPRRR